METIKKIIKKLINDPQLNSVDVLYMGGRSEVKKIIDRINKNYGFNFDVENSKWIVSNIQIYRTNFKNIFKIVISFYNTDEDYHDYEGYFVSKSGKLIEAQY